MKKKRIIPVLLLRNGFLVQSKSFTRYQNLGNPVTAVKRLSAWASDELIYLDISREGGYDIRRDDLRDENRQDFLDIVRAVSSSSFMPITLGGRIRTADDILARLANGADKVSINTMAVDEPSLLTEGAKRFGSQCIVVSIDAKRHEDGRYEAFVDGGKRPAGLTPWELAKRSCEAGAGEILINSIDRDGRGQGYDLELVQKVVESVNVPVIAMGGAGEWDHLVELLEKTGVEAAAAANIFHYTEASVFRAKQHLHRRGCLVRPPELILENKVTML
jgi:cyclase